MFRNSGSDFKIYMYSGNIFKSSRSGNNSNSLHVEINKVSSTEPTGSTLLQAIVQKSSVPVSQKWGQTLSTNYSVGLNGMAYG